MSDKKDHIPEFARAMARAIINRDRMRNLRRLKPGQRRWQHTKAIELSEEFEALVDDRTFVTFWTRENVVADIEAGDVKGVAYWLGAKIWSISQRSETEKI